MKLAGGILAFLFVMTVVLAVYVAHRARPWPDCVSQVVMVKDAAGKTARVRLPGRGVVHVLRSWALAPCCPEAIVAV
jgi:hypothetical protein